MLMQRIAAQLRPYPLRRDLSDNAAASCYLGVLESCFARQGLPVSEDDLFALGGAYRLVFRQDEYGEPELWFPFMPTMDTLCERLDCSLGMFTVDGPNLVPQLRRSLADGHGVLAWVYSAHLDYTDDPYARRGYVHAVLLESIDDDAKTVTLTDRQLATTPTCACVAELPLASVRRALTEIPWTQTYPGSGLFHVVRARSKVDVSIAVRRDALGETANAILADLQGNAPIPSFASAAREWVESGGTMHQSSRLESINRVISVDHVLPSRRALRRSVEAARFPSFAAAGVRSAVESTIAAWELLAYQLRKASRTGVVGEHVWTEGFARAAAQEELLWRAVRGAVDACAEEGSR